MSTILQALEKNKFDRIAPSSPNLQASPKLLQWRIAISLALFIIIILLSTVVYLLLNPQIQLPNSTPPQALSAQTSNPIVKANFNTQPLPEVITTTAVKPQIAPAPTKEKKVQKQQPITIAKEEKIEVADKSDKAVEYNDVSDDLKKRFELALLMTDMEEGESSEADVAQQKTTNDGSNIRDMNRDFQQQVPPIRYDSHMYSSLVEERWIRINGEVLKEGEFDSTGQIELIEIQPQRSIFRLDRQSFSVESLTDWRGY